MMIVAHEAREQTDRLELLARMRLLLTQVDVGGREIFDRWRTGIGRRAFVPAAWNFAAYLALRQIDLREIQTSLMPLGLSSLGRCEGRVRPNLEAVVEALAALCGEAATAKATTARAFFRSEE